MLSLLLTAAFTQTVYFAQANLTWYDPSLCEAQPINCYNPDQWWKMAAGDDAREWFGKSLACPQEFPLGTIFEVQGSMWGLADGEYVCMDRGGAVTIGEDGVIQLDLLRHTPVWRETLIVKIELPYWVPKSKPISVVRDIKPQ